MDDEQCVDNIQRKIERLTERSIEFQVDRQEADQLQVDLEREVPLVVMGSNIFNYSGFARMCVEYAVASIRQQRPIDMLEFHILLGRN